MMKISKQYIFEEQNSTSTFHADGNDSDGFSVGTGGNWAML